MKNVFKLESAGLFLLFTTAYFYLFPGNWGFYLEMFFIPDVSFALILISKKLAVIAYNIFHHQGVLAMLLTIFLMLNYNEIKSSFIEGWNRN
jgi:hypothetical protein